MYKLGQTFQNILRADANCNIHGRKWQGGGSALLANPKKGHSGKPKKNNTGQPRNKPDKDQKYMLHIPINSTQEGKVLQDFSEKHARQQPHK